MQVVMTQELIMDNSHNVVLSDLPIPTGEKFTVIVLRDNTEPKQPSVRKVYAHRFPVDSIDLPTRETGNAAMLLQRLKENPLPPECLRTEEEIDAQIEQERNAWE